MKTFKLNGFEFVKVSVVNVPQNTMSYVKYIKFCPKLKLSIVYISDIYEYPKLKIGCLEYIEFRLVGYKNINYYKVDDLTFNISDGFDCLNYFFSYKDSIKYMSTNYSDCKKFLLLI